MKLLTGVFRGVLGGLCVFASTLIWPALPPAFAQKYDLMPSVPGGANGGLWSGAGKAYSPAYGGPGDCSCYPWQVVADALLVQRATSATDISLAFGNPADPRGSQILNARDLEFDIQWYPRIGLARCCTDFTSIGIEYFGIKGWEATGQVAGPLSVQFPSIAHQPVPPVGGAALATFDYRSELSNLEINLRHRCADMSWLTLIAGFRWIELGEEFFTTYETGGLTSAYAIDVNNHLYGFQLGADANIRRFGGWSIDGWLKAGVYGNAADQDTLENLAAMGGGAASISANGSDVAFAGDTGISIKRYITEQLSVRVGYQLLWIEGVALAPDQVDNSNPTAQLATLDHSGSVFYHGGFAGLEYVW